MAVADEITIVSHDGAKIVLRLLARPGAPRLILSHGNGFAIEGYRKFWELLAADFELVLFDLRNHGRNPLGPIEGHNLAAMALDHVRVLEETAALGPRKTLGLFHSASSIAAIRAGAEHGARWDGLILYDPPLIAPEGNPLRDMNRKLDETLANFAHTRPHHFATQDELAAQFRQRLGRNWAEGAEFDMARGVTRPAPEGGFQLCCPGAYEARIYSDNASYGSFEAVAALRQPTLLICADPNMPRALPPASSGPQAAAKFGLPCVSVAETGHLLQIEKPEIVARHTREFIGTLDLA